MSTPTLLDRARYIIANASHATARPWKWWTSNSRDRLSSKPSGKDGDVLDAVRAADGVPVLSVKGDDMIFIVGACNGAEELAAFAVEFAEALPGLVRTTHDITFDRPQGPSTCNAALGGKGCVCGMDKHNASLTALAARLGIGLDGQPLPPPGDST